MARRRNANAAALAAAQAAAARFDQEQRQRQKRARRTPNRGNNGGAPVPPDVEPQPGASQPGPQRRPVDPFLTPEQQQALNEYLAGLDSELVGLATNYAQQAANVARDAGDIVGGRYRDVAGPDGRTYREYLGDGQLSNSGTLWARGAGARQSSDSALAARGLSQSSIRDTDLGDIETATTLARTNMMSALAQLSAQNETTRNTLNTNRNTTVGNYNALAVQNAQAVEPAPDPTPAPTPAAPQAPKPSIPTPRVNLKRRNQRATAGAQNAANSASAYAQSQQSRAGGSLSRRPTVRVGRPFHGGARVPR